MAGGALTDLAQLELLLDGSPDDDGTFEAFIRLMADPAHNPQLRKDTSDPGREEDPQAPPGDR